MRHDYTRKELYRALSGIITDENEVIFITGDLSYLGKGDFSDKKDCLETYYNYVNEIAGKHSTIVVPTFSLNLANTDIPFDVNKTATNLGVFPNYVLQKEAVVRSRHPFVSFAAVGPKANFICSGSTRFPYGIDSPFERMLSLRNPLTVSIGLEPRLTCSLAHHVEFVMHVPYRYTKEFDHPVRENDTTKREKFYLSVVYRGINEKRDKNKKFFENFERKYDIKRQGLGKGSLYGYDMSDFYGSALELMKKDIYSWLTEEPQLKPYTI